MARSTTTEKSTTTTTQRSSIVRQLTPRGPKSYFVKQPVKPYYYGQKLLSNEIDVDNKVAEERHDQYYVTPKRTSWPTRSRRKSLFGGPPSPRGPTLASAVISSLKPRSRYQIPRYPSYAPRSRIHQPVLATPATRRISNGDHRYVKFFRGQIGGPSWGYSYHL